MERLTENKRNSDGTGVSKQSLIDRCGKGYPSNYTHAIVTKLADYEDAEEQGLLLRLPCKVEDKVYQITRNSISEYIITSVHIYPHGIHFRWYCEKGIYKNLNGFYDSEIGKTVFFTREGAEAKLKKMEGSHD